MEIDIDRTMADLVSADLETQCVALEEVGRMVGVLTAQALKGFESSDVPRLMAERLGFVGKAVTGQIEEFILSRQRDELRVLASINLLYIGSNYGLDDVIQEFRDQGPHEMEAVYQLVNARVPGTDQLIIERLRKFSSQEFSDPKRFDYIDSLIVNLQRLDARLPDDIRETIQRVEGLPHYLRYRLPKARS